MRSDTRHRLALYFKGTTQAARRELLTIKLLSPELLLTADSLQPPAPSTPQTSALNL